MSFFLSSISVCHVRSSLAETYPPPDPFPWRHLWSMPMLHVFVNQRLCIVCDHLDHMTWFFYTWRPCCESFWNPYSSYVLLFSLKTWDCKTVDWLYFIPKLQRATCIPIECIKLIFLWRLIIFSTYQRCTYFLKRYSEKNDVGNVDIPCQMNYLVVIAGNTIWKNC